VNEPTLSKNGVNQLLAMLQVLISIVTHKILEQIDPPDPEIASTTGITLIFQRLFTISELN
jgi:hypothetical protein